MNRSRLLLLGLVACASGTGTRDPGLSPLGSREAVDTISFETTEATRLAFDIAPDGRSIVFDLFGQLWRLPAEGGAAIPLTNAVRDTAEDFDPAISPDGRRIAFQSDRPGGRALWLVSATGGTPRKLTTRRIPYFTYVTPAWSPDGARIAYSLGDTLFVLDLETGTEVAQRLDSLPPASRQAPFTPRNSAPVWSPDGARLLFVNTAPAPVRGDGRIWTAPGRGGTAHPLTTLRGLAPALSPDGSQLTFFSRDSLNRWQLWVQPATAGGAARVLTSHDEVITYRARWTPDGRAIVYSADGKLWRVAPSGGAPVEIPFRARLSLPRRRSALRPVEFPNPGEARAAKGFGAIALSADGRRLALLALDSLWVGDVGAPPRAIAPAVEAGDAGLTWSPDGRELAWTRRERAGKAFDLVISDARSGATRLVFAAGQDVFRPTWSPDGRWIAFLAGGRLRLVDPAAGERADRVRDLGPATTAWGTLAWSPASDALVVATTDLNARRQTAQWVPLAGERRSIERFPRGAANLTLTADGRAFWIENDQLWQARFEGPAGLRDTPVPVASDAALEARIAQDGSTLYLSVDGLRWRTPQGQRRTLGWPLSYRAMAAPPPLLIRGARVLDGRGSPLSEPRDVLIADARIARIGPANTLPAGGARVLNASGAYLVPGLIDLHAHLWDDLQLAGWLHNGVTTVRDIGSQKLRTADTRNAIEAGIRDGPRIVYGGAMFHRGPAGYSTVGDQMVSDSGALARAVAIQAGMDAGFVKERGFDEWWSAVRLVHEAHRHGLRVGGHCEHVLPLVAAGVDGVEHVLDCFRDRSTLRADYAGLARAAGLWVDPTAALRWSMLRGMDDSTLAGAPDVAPFLLPAYRSLYLADSANRAGRPAGLTVIRRLERSIRRYREFGVLLGTGTDSPFPLGVQHEMELLVESGLTPMEALVAATGAAARILGAPEIGTIAEGQWADLLLLDANPLDDIRNLRRIREVIQRGRSVDRARLRQAGLRLAP